MPRTIRNYAIDYNKNQTIELKIKTHLLQSKSFKNNRMEKINPVLKIDLKDNIQKISELFSKKYKNKKGLILKKYIDNYESLNISENRMAAIIIPIHIIPGAETLSPAYLIFDNYEKFKLE